MKKIISISILSMLLLLLVGCTDAEKATDSSGNTKKDFEQEEIATVNNVNYSITKIERTKGKEYFEAGEGKEYVIFTIQIENKSDKKISYNALDWKVEDSSGDEKTYALWGGDTNVDLNSGDLNSGGAKIGTIAFEVPKDDKKLKLKYYDNMLSENYTVAFIVNE